MCKEELRRVCEYCIHRCCHAPSNCLAAYAQTQILKFDTILQYAEANAKNGPPLASHSPIVKPISPKQQSPFCGNTKRKRLIIPVKRIVLPPPRLVIDLSEGKETSEDEIEDILDSGALLPEPLEPPRKHARSTPSAPRLSPLTDSPDPPPFSLDLDDLYCGELPRSPSPLFQGFEDEFCGLLLFAEAS